MEFLVAYDISDPKRLRKVAKFWERNGLRVQRSVFRVTNTNIGLRLLMEQLEEFIDEEKDTVAAWRLSSHEEAIHLGLSTSGTPSALVISNETHFVQRSKRR